MYFLIHTAALILQCLICSYVLCPMWPHNCAPCPSPRSWISHFSAHIRYDWPTFYICYVYWYSQSRT